MHIDPLGSRGDMTGNQLRAARSLLGWSQSQVAVAAGVSVPTVKRAEGSGALAASETAKAAIRAALEGAGEIFLEANGEGAGVRLRK
jgi:transcriptional regulator with XRE-family HTH domain